MISRSPIASGYLTITGRIKELIIRGGQNIAPAEIEEVVVRHPQVQDCAVVGHEARDARRGAVSVRGGAGRRVGRGGAAGSLQDAFVRLQDPGGHASRRRNSRAPGPGKIMRFKLVEALDAATLSGLRPVQSTDRGPSAPNDFGSYARR